MANSKYKAAEYLRRGADHEKRAAEQTLIQNLRPASSSSVSSTAS
jgi:hypothetical protein